MALEIQLWCRVVRTAFVVLGGLVDNKRALILKFIVKNVFMVRLCVWLLTICHGNATEYFRGHSLV